MVRGIVEQSTPDGDGALVTVVPDSGDTVRLVGRFVGRAREPLAVGSAAVLAIRPTALRLGKAGDDAVG